MSGASIDQKRVDRDCRPGFGEATCRYLTMAPTGWTCAKGDDRLRPYLDDRVARGTIRARGDNCEGVR